MDNIQIGEATNKCSAISIGHYDSDIYKNANVSENTEEYWCRSNLLDVSIHINKETVEAKNLAKLIEKGSAKRINTFLDNIAIKHCDAKILKQKIERIQEMSFEEGRKDAQETIRIALGL